MKLPKSIKIGAHKIKIEFPYEFENEDKSKHQLGNSNFTLSRIRIAKFNCDGEEMPASMIWATFIHELFHMIDAISGHQLFLDGSRKSELIVGTFSEIILQILVDNKYIKLES